LQPSLDVRGVSAVPYMPPSELRGDRCPYCVEALARPFEVDSPLSGAHQHRNLALAIAAAVELAGKHGFPVTPAAIAEGIRQTRWPARLERIQRTAAWNGFSMWRTIPPAPGRLRAGLNADPRRSEAAHPHLQLPARQAGRRDGADSVSAL
jgi:dihydrofolate synthase / folylpolyglutamate synthase